MKRIVLSTLLTLLGLQPVRAVTDSLSITITIAPGVGIAQEQIPATYHITKPYPNPFNPRTRFTIALPQMSQIQAQVFDLRGHRITELAVGEFAAGYHDIVWNADGIASGLYLIRIQSRFGTTLSKVLLLK